VKEILCWQQARSDYLKSGYANTIWFHLRASMRHAKRLISCLVDDDSVQYTYDEVLRELFKL